MLSTVQLYHFCCSLALARNFLIALYLNQSYTSLKISSAVLLDAEIMFRVPVQSQEH